MKRGLKLIDTYEAVKQLEASGLTEEQAGALVKVINSTSGKLATKADLTALQAATSADLTALQAATNADLQALESALRGELKQFATKNDLLVLVGLNFAAISLAVTIIKLF